MDDARRYSIEEKLVEEAQLEAPAETVEQAPIAPELAENFKDKETIDLLEEDSVSTGG
jgi:hypothetical protein